MPERMSADGAFSYACARCRRCCTGKRIRVNPYEVYRLARNRGLSTTAFLAAYAVHGGTELAVREDGSCVFLGEHGCTVHSDRPLVCRLYPLGRAVEPGAPDRYFELEPHPETEGRYGRDGSVADFLGQQRAAPFLNAADRYLDLLGRLAATIGDLVESEPAGAADEVRNAIGLTPLAEMSGWLDIDAVLARDAGPTARDAEEAMSSHISALEQWRRSLSDRSAPDEQLS